MRDATLLIVEDDQEIRGLVADFLRREGFVVETAETGAGMDRVLARVTPDLVVLDIMLPGEDGLSICRRLRARGSQLPILMLTAKEEDIDRIVGLESAPTIISASRSIPVNCLPVSARCCAAFALTRRSGERCVGARPSAG